MKHPISFTSHGKWILAGEHSVLRGGAALTFPYQKGYIKSLLNKVDKELQVSFSGPYGSELELIFWGTLEKALKAVNRQRSDIRGLLQLESHLPLGKGLGASAAICVTIGRWFSHLNWLTQAKVYEFSRELENNFHGESSGVDIASALSPRGILFVRGQRLKFLELNWQPRWFLSYSGQQGVTSSCVSKVKTLWNKDPQLGREIDEQMNEAVSLAESALSIDEEQGLHSLMKAIKMAKNCFERWGLTEGSLGQHMKDLISQGALAVKPTGSGGGGYVLSLWGEPPPRSLQEELLDI